MVKKLNTGNKDMFGKLVLIPTPISEDTDMDDFAISFLNKIFSIKEFVVEDIRTARRFLKKINHPIAIDDMKFYVHNEHTKNIDFSEIIHSLKMGNSIGLMSEAGCPCVADPGSDLVSVVQQNNLKIEPLVGPNSILLALMASGLNGQHFAFYGYLPIKLLEKVKKLKEIEKEIFQKNQTAIFIETPYRNQKLLVDILNGCNSSLRLCIAIDVQGKNESIKTKPIREWKKINIVLPKNNAVFLLGL